MSSFRVIVADVLEGLAQLDAGSVQTCITSPPYWGLRDYGDTGQLGLEPTPEDYTQRIVEVFREVRRVLRDDGTVWLNLGDSYAGGAGGRGDAGRPATMVPRGKGGALIPSGTSAPQDGIRLPRGLSGLKPKDLVGIPWRVAFALQADGWYLRSDIIWAKSNPMPESVTDRPTKSHEYLFLLTKSARYYFDADAVRERGLTDERPRSAWDERREVEPIRRGDPGQSQHVTTTATLASEAGRNIRTVWNVATEPFPGAHFATFPKKLIEPCVKAGSRIGDTVLDPFCGSGTTGVVALRHQRDFIGVELNPAYAAMARERIYTDGPLFNVEAV